MKPSGELKLDLQELEDNRRSSVLGFTLVFLSTLVIVADIVVVGFFKTTAPGLDVGWVGLLIVPIILFMILSAIFLIEELPRALRVKIRKARYDYEQALAAESEETLRKFEREQAK